MNIHLPAILGFTRYQGFDPSPYLQLGGVRRDKDRFLNQKGQGH